MKSGDEIIADAIRAGCLAASTQLHCDYPACTCMTPTIVRAALAEYWRAKGER